MKEWPLSCKYLVWPEVGLLTMTIFCLNLDRSSLLVSFLVCRSLVVNYLLYCADWVVVTGGALDHPIEQNSILFHKFHYIDYWLHCIQFISKIIKLYSLNDRNMISEVPYFSQDLMFYVTKNITEKNQNEITSTKTKKSVASSLRFS